MAYKDIKYEQEGHLVTITIERSDRNNTCTSDTTGELIDAWHTFREDNSAWCAILTGEGDDFFSDGIDTKWLLEEIVKNGDSRHSRRPVDHREGMGGITQEFECWKPMIAAVNGDASHAGFDMAMACDFIIAGEHTKFEMSAPKIFGMAEQNGVSRLVRQLPLKIAMGILMTGGELTAQEGARWGLVNELAQKGEVMTVARRWADRVLECAPIALRGTKEWATRQFDLPYTVALTHKHFSWEEMNSSDDGWEGLLAYTKGERYEYKGQ